MIQCVGMYLACALEQVLLYDNISYRYEIKRMPSEPRIVGTFYIPEQYTSLHAFCKTLGTESTFVSVPACCLCLYGSDTVDAVMFQIKTI